MHLHEKMILADRYEIIRALGAGGMGAAYLAQDRRLARHCVIKEMISLDAATQSQFEREARLLASLRHPNLPEAYHYFVHQGHPFLVMAYVEGQTLDQLPELAIQDVLGWTYGLLAALDYMHGHDPPVIHRDIKPANVCITPGNKAVLLDFGIARPLDETQTRIAAQGWSQGYAPIEQYRRAQLRHIPTALDYLEKLRAEGIRSGPYTDIYGLGATLYFALTQLPPPDAALRVVQDELHPIRAVNPRVPDSVAAAVTRALSIHPQQRFQSAAEMRKALQPDTSPVVVPPAPIVSEPPLEPKRLESTRPSTLDRPTPSERALRPRWLALGIGAGLALVIALAWLLFGGGGESAGPSQQGIAEIASQPLTRALVTPPTPTHTREPTATRTPSPTPTTSPTSSSTPAPTVPPSPTPLPTPYSFHFTVNDEQLTVYTAPGENYEVLDVVHRGDRLLAVGRVPDETWWQVNYFGMPGWNAPQPVGPDVDPSALPVVPTPRQPTLVPATATPTSSPPTAVPTPACPTMTLGEFATAWREPLIAQRLGCPQADAQIIDSVYAYFEHGFMYWRQDRLLIYVVYDDGRWQEFPDTWTPDEQDSAGFDPPDGLLEPVRGFGKVWREQLGGPNAEIGWATGNEVAQATVLQEFQRGTILELGATVYLLYRDGMTWQKYYVGIGVPTPVTPPSLRLAFVLGFVDNADVWVINADGSGRFALAAGDGDQSEPDWSPDGQRVIYQSNQAGNYDLWVIGVAGGDARALTRDVVDEREPDWSPDGTQLVYRRGGERNGDGELWRMAAEGADPVPLGGVPVLGRAPVWSPGGQYVAFMSVRSGNWNIYLLDLDSGEVRQITDCETHCRFPAWSLDGQYIAYNVTESVDNFAPIQVWRVRVDGSSTPELLIQGNHPGRPVWSREGWIAFNSDEGIEIMNADGSGRHPLANTDEGWAPDWSR